AVPDRGAYEKGPRGQGGDNLGEVERHLRRVTAVYGADAGHVAVVAPAGQVALHVSREAAKPAAGHDALHAVVERGQAHAVGPAERMADGPDPLAVHVGQRPQQIDTPHVIPDALHGRTDITVGIRVEAILAHVHVIRRDRDIPALG